jgi:hypothetical protein
MRAGRSRIDVMVIVVDINIDIAIGVWLILSKHISKPKHRARELHR